MPPMHAQSDCACRTGTRTAPSRKHCRDEGLPGSLPKTYVRHTAWDKIPRMGEADNGPHHFGAKRWARIQQTHTPWAQDHLRDVTKAVANDLRKIAVLPDKLEGDTAGLQVAWALISKTLPPRAVHLLRAHPVEQTQETCDTLQDSLLDTVRQLLGQPTITADQLHLAKLPVTAGGLGLPRLPTLALVARTSCIATLPRAAHTDMLKTLSDKRGITC